MKRMDYAILLMEIGTKAISISLDMPPALSQTHGCLPPVPEPPRETLAKYFLATVEEPDRHDRGMDGGVENAVHEHSAGVEWVLQDAAEVDATHLPTLLADEAARFEIPGNIGRVLLPGSPRFKRKSSLVPILT